MEKQMDLTILLQMSGGLGLFLFGMSLMSAGIEKAAGAKLRSILEMFTKNPFIGMIVGIIFTGIIQSSSACTAMVVSFVNSGLMTLGQAAGVIFGATGGVMEAALRTAVKALTGEDPGDPEFTDVRGMEGIKEATYNVGGLEIKVCVASGTKNAKIVMDKIKSGECDYTFVEIMCCPGGCINGGGQPIVPASIKNFTDVKALRAGALYRNDAADKNRFSHENTAVKRVYDEFFGEPGSHVAHEVLHTTYVKRSLYND